jgi:hypothetical protein
MHILGELNIPSISSPGLSRDKYLDILHLISTETYLRSAIGFTYPDEGESKRKTRNKRMQVTYWLKVTEREIKKRNKTKPFVSTAKSRQYS